MRACVHADQKPKAELAGEERTERPLRAKYSTALHPPLTELDG